MKNSFYLVIPKQQNESSRLKEFEAKALQQWLDDLPNANLALATRLIHDFVLELNTLAMPSQLRLDVLERIGPNVYIIEDYLQGKLIKSSFPKNENEHKIFEVLISIEKECAIGYWTTIKEFTHRDAGWFKGKNTALSIQRCIKMLGCIVTNYFIMRLSIPDWIWIDLHSLYKLSLTVNHNATKVVNNLKQLPTTLSPEACYQHILLLSLADTTGLIQKEIPIVYDFIQSIPPLISFKNVPIVSQKVQCLIQTDEDKPPYFQTDIEHETDNYLRYLDLTHLYKFLDQQIKLSNRIDPAFLDTLFGTNKSTIKLPAELMNYLQQRWFGIELQSSSLFSDRFDRYMTIGLSSAHDLRSVSSATATQAKSITEEQEEFLVQSASDKLLTAVFKESGVLSVGSLVSFRKKNEPADTRSLGITNMVSAANQAGKIIFGVQLLAASFYAVLLKPRRAADKDAPQKGIFYNVKESNVEKNYIITDYFMLEDNDIIDLFIEQESFPVTMKNRKNIGLGYWQFDCQRLVEQATQGHSKKGYDFI